MDEIRSGWKQRAAIEQDINLFKKLQWPMAKERGFLRAGTGILQLSIVLGLYRTNRRWRCWPPPTSPGTICFVSTIFLRTTQPKRVGALRQAGVLTHWPWPTKRDTALAGRQKLELPQISPHSEIYRTA